jgi:tyrosyl-tRNA synthetase
MLIKALSQALGVESKRIQFTPDLLPGDITGNPILQEREGHREFVFQRGPLFASMVLADEISPDGCRLWDLNTGEKMDKDRFRRDLGQVMEAYEEVLKLNGRVTLQQMLQREDFRNRLDSAQEVRLHEIQYPIMQGWDSVMVRSDVEIGGTDQLFNILVGRDLQKEEGQAQQVVLLMPLLEGLDGAKKMSKSYNNYVGVNDAPQEMFGKLMSISDELMDRYYQLLLGESRDTGTHPMDAKKLLAQKLTARYHDETLAFAAREDWQLRFSKKNLADAELPEIPLAGLPGDLTVLSLSAHAFLTCFSMEKSNSELRKQFITTGSVQLNGEKLTDPAASVAPVAGDVLKLSKKHAVRFT